MNVCATALELPLSEVTSFLEAPSLRGEVMVNLRVDNRVGLAGDSEHWDPLNSTAGWT